MKKDVITPKPQWWKHLRPFWKRSFWGRERATYRQRIREESDDSLSTTKLTRNGGPGDPSSLTS